MLITKFLFRRGFKHGRYICLYSVVATVQTTALLIEVIELDIIDTYFKRKNLVASSFELLSHILNPNHDVNYLKKESHWENVHLPFEFGMRYYSCSTCHL